MHLYVSYLEGCTAPKFDKNQLHAAVVELVALDDAQIKYSTVQNCMQVMRKVVVVSTTWSRNEASVPAAIRRFRGRKLKLVRQLPGSTHPAYYTQCDSMLIGSNSGANAFPYIEVMNNTSRDRTC